ncbi:hypothetical protein KR222_011435, partial [Zaprionus bogoriensis]
KKLKRLPINLRRKLIREARNMAGMQERQPKQRRPRKSHAPKQNDFERAEHNAMLAATAQELQQILAAFEELADVPYDCTPAELWAKIARAEGRGTTVYVQRDGLSTLKIVLPQSAPTIAQLKKAIASIALAQHKRRQREQRREAAEAAAGRAEGADRRQQVVAGAEAKRCSSCELVNSAQRNGHEHRAHVSWRFLWRCFALFNVDTNQPIDDNAAGAQRATLTDLGIENGAKLKFVHRVKYFGRRRQT